jgi:hypothetical protein
MNDLCGDVYEEWAHDGLALDYGETVVCTKPPHAELDGHYSEERKFGWMTYPGGAAISWTEAQE